jgi:hypothetical protein
MSVSRRSSRSSIDRQVQAEAFLDRLFGTRLGIIAAAYGIDGHLTTTGSYTFDGKWKPVFFDWPADRQKFIKSAVHRLGPDYDVYLIPNLRSDRTAKVEFGLESEYIWADIDKVTDDTWKRLGAVLSQGSFLVRSGGAGHLHAYLRLDGLYPREVYEELNQRFAGYIGGDPKFRDNSLLRLPGTLNHKGRAAGGESLPVVLEDVTDSDIPPWSPEALSELLGPLAGKRTTSTAGKSSKTNGTNVTRGRKTSKGSVAPIVPVDVEPLPDDPPGEVRRLLRSTNARGKLGDQSRSAHLHRLIGVCMAYGYRDGQIMGLAMSQMAAEQKWPNEALRSREIQRSIDKLRPCHPHEGRTCRASGCHPYTPPEVIARIDEIRRQLMPTTDLDLVALQQISKSLMPSCSSH